MAGHHLIAQDFNAHDSRCSELVGARCDAWVFTQATRVPNAAAQIDREWCPESMFSLQVGLLQWHRSTVDNRPGTRRQTPERRLKPQGIQPGVDIHRTGRVDTHGSRLFRRKTESSHERTPDPLESPGAKSSTVPHGQRSSEFAVAPGPSC